MKKRLVLGIMSGTSIDGVDYALCEIRGERVALRELWSVAFPRRLRETLHAAARGELASHPLAQAHHDLGRFYAAHARDRADLVGLHGQTVFHNPSPSRPATLQLGEPSYLAEWLRAPVVSNFRAADIAAGGQGAPLATLFHRIVFARRGAHICVNNLGGISNVTSLDWRDGGPEPRVAAFDTGPANVLIDMAMRHFTGGKQSMDRDGKWAARGSVREELIRQWLKHPYFRQKPPKSTGRELFGEPFFAAAMREMRTFNRYDIAATFTEFTARSLALNYRKHLPGPPDEIILTGGGASNPTLIAALARQLGGVRASAEFGWPAQAIEPAAFALLAEWRMRGRPGNLPETTGARRAVLLGQVTRA